jgi:hypothetical protein
MPYDKDLRELIKATKKASRPLPETIEERAQKIHERGAVAGANPPGEPRHNQQTD